MEVNVCLRGVLEGIGELMMNKIEQLLQKAEVYQPNDVCQPQGLPSNWDDDDYILTKDGAKFLVKLIIEECSSILPEDCHSKNGCHISHEMLKHFGINDE